MTWSFIDDYDEQYYLGYDMAQLVVDQFYLNVNISTSDDKPLYLYTLQRECIECPYVRHCDDGHCFITNNTTSIFNTNLKLRMSTKNEEYLPQDQTDSVICDIDTHFGEFGIYGVDINQSGCSVQTLKEPVNEYTPIVTVSLIYICLYLCIYAICIGWKKFRNTNITSREKEPKKERIHSLDTFRGIAIVIMIFANYGCGGYVILDHAKWNGLHMSDLVFPWFIWIMGACIPISLTSSFKKNIPNSELVKKISSRSIKLFCLGVFLTSGSDLEYLRIFGVLQRFGVAYFFCSVICVYLMKRSTDRSEHKWMKEFDDITKLMFGWIFALALVVVHTILIFTVSAPGCPKGYLGPGGLHKNLTYRNCIGGATGYIDGLILGEHRYQKPTIYEIYESKPFDPEGIVGCLTTIFHTFIGVQAGTTLIVYKEHSERLIRWLVWAITTGLIGGALCGFSKEDGLIPVNKSLWSLSFVMITSCFAFLLLSFCYVIIDVKKWWNGKPFVFAGMNSILMFIGHEMTDGHFPIRWYPHNDIVSDDPRRTHFLALLSDVWGVEMWVLISYYLHKIKYFFNV